LSYLEPGCISYRPETGWEVYAFYREHLEVLACKASFPGSVYGDHRAMRDLFRLGLIRAISVKNNTRLASEADEFDA
jgi:hypothetical protein